MRKPNRERDMLNTIKFGWKAGMVLMVALSVFGAVVFLHSTNAAAWDSNSGSTKEKGHTPVTICHATGSDKNPYIKITVDDDSVDEGSGHNSDGHQGGRDIIPPGFWDENGRNWNHDDIEIYNNGCRAVETSSTPTPAPTPTPTPVPTPTPTPVSTPTPPTFPRCIDQSGVGDKAHYESGLHQIVGSGLLEGKDDVYTLSNGDYLQCFVPPAKDVCIQTNWWRTDAVLAGWYSLNGTQWDLGNFHYLARNINYNCLPPSPTPSPTPTPTPAPVQTVNNTNNNTNNNSQNQSQTQNNDQTVNVTVNQTVTGQVEGTKSAITRSPETGPSVLGMTTIFGMLPFGLFLARFGMGKRKIVPEEISLSTLGRRLVGKRSKRA